MRHVLWFTCSLGLLAAAEPVGVISPDGRIRADISTDGGHLRYGITVDGQPVVLPSELGITSNGVDLGRDASLGATERGTVDETYRVFGQRASTRNHAHRAAIAVTSGGQTWTLDVHVADSGVAVRSRLPAASGRKIQADGSTWRLAGDPTVWTSRGIGCYENTLATTTVAALESGGKAYDLPLTAKVGPVYVALTEAALIDYGDLGLQPAADHALVGTLVADGGGWSTDTAVNQPWRVTMIARDLNALVNNTLVQDLNPAPRADLVDAAWIRPGRATWQWMAAGDPKLAEQPQWVTWTADLGFEYYLVDDGWKKWKNGDKDCWTLLTEVCAQAKAKGIGVWLWVHSREVKEAGERAAYFDKAVAAGVVGVKIDFMPATNRWWSTWYHDTARDAADRRLLVDFHGATKPTGMDRTWPNELTREGIRGHEWQMTRYKRVLDPAHDSILPFTRYLAGHGDYTPTVFEPKELVGNTWAHELAQAIVFTSPFLCFGGHPKDYVANPAVDVLKAIPATWDETRVLAGSRPGTMAAMARRKGNTWFIASLTGAQPQTLDTDLTFLGDGPWTATILTEDPARNDGWTRQERTLTAADRLSLPQRAQSGAVVWLRR